MREYGLEAFDFNVLSLARTFAEKIMALVRVSYETDPVAAAGRKVRHLYDLQQLVSHPEIVALLAGPGLAQQLAAVQRDDARAGVIGPTREWKTRPLTACWAYTEQAANLRQLQQPYERDLPRLLHSQLPAFDQVLLTMRRIAQLLRSYDGL
ncbi:nucleotidyl transferase AbiEii/AbiGii toxin family protein [Hymenobacter setariae]|uniref:Nucleotidyl transferase AbiEii/AbiGii toxin family protein n=1 Tax=Hymenobacter setariae TaxID=2594794 RepID=A0A558BKI3_9BACT|nr:nucleotidyl transferase AbiEii/AbiGii toxin family protein [Hymenobacter setariae]TVT37024.1 nucleotidyl transferase AbiEii/AbiGii toxin family protein [Hymenobacter setariae]